VSNWYLWWSGGSYFGPGDEQNPFLHTWSLGIEEQFYFFAPLLLAMGHLWRSRRGGLITFGAVTATSFALSGVLMFAARSGFDCLRFGDGSEGGCRTSNCSPHGQNKDFIGGRNVVDVIPSGSKQVSPQARDSSGRIALAKLRK
jgi:hypothetical protein